MRARPQKDLLGGQKIYVPPPPSSMAGYGNDMHHPLPLPLPLTMEHSEQSCVYKNQAKLIET